MNRQARKTQLERDPSAKKEVRENLQQTKDQKMCLEVNRQARKTQLERNPTAKEKVREQKQAEQLTQLEEKEDDLQ